MTNFSKCLAVLATVASLAFLGIVSVSAIGGPNYENELDAPELNDVVFDKKVDDETGIATWTARTRKQQRSDPNNPASAYQEKVLDQDTKILPRALIKSYQFLNAEQTREITALEKRITNRKQQITDAKRVLALDMKALEDRIAGLRQLKAKTELALKTIQDRVAGKQQDDQKARDKAKRREEDITRIEIQIAEMIAEKSRLATQKTKLTVLLDELEATVAALQRRNNRLRAGTKTTTATPVATN